MGSALNRRSSDRAEISPIGRELIEAISCVVSSLTARVVLRTSLRRAGIRDSSLRRDHLSEAFVAHVAGALEFYNLSEKEMDQILGRVRRVAKGEGRSSSGQEEAKSTTFCIRLESDVVAARGEARQLAQRIGCCHADQIKIATAVSEVGRNMLLYAGSGTITVKVTQSPKPAVRVLAEDQGPGIPHLEQVLGGNYRSTTGMGLGIRGCQRLMDEFAIESSHRGTSVTMTKFRA